MKKLSGILLLYSVFLTYEILRVNAYLSK